LADDLGAGSARKVSELLARRSAPRLDKKPGVSDQPLELRSKCLDASARGLAGLDSLPPLHSAALQLRKLRFRSTAFRSRQI
jgi:hypothetical protein